MSAVLDVKVDALAHATNVGVDPDVIAELVNECEHIRSKIEQASKMGDITIGDKFTTLIDLMVKAQMKSEVSHDIDVAAIAEASSAGNSIPDEDKTSISKVSEETDDACADRNEDCQAWAQAGGCKGEYAEAMKVSCRLSCKVCIPSGTLSEHIDIADLLDEKDGDSSKAGRGDTERNAIFLNTEEDPDEFELTKATRADDDATAAAGSSPDSQRLTMSSLLRKTETSSKRSDGAESALSELLESSDSAQTDKEQAISDWEAIAASSPLRSNVEVQLRDRISDAEAEDSEKKIKSLDRDKASIAGAEVVAETLAKEQRESSSLSAKATEAETGGGTSNDYDEEDAVITEEREKRQEFSRESDEEEGAGAAGDVAEKYYVESEELDIAKGEDLTVAEGWDAATKEFEEHNLNAKEVGNGDDLQDAGADGIQELSHDTGDDVNAQMQGDVDITTEASNAPRSWASVWVFTGIGLVIVLCLSLFLVGSRLTPSQLWAAIGASRNKLPRSTSMSFVLPTQEGDVDAAATAMISGIEREVPGPDVAADADTGARKSGRTGGATPTLSLGGMSTAKVAQGATIGKEKVVGTEAVTGSGLPGDKSKRSPKAHALAIDVPEDWYADESAGREANSPGWDSWDTLNDATSFRNDKPSVTSNLSKNSETSSEQLASTRAQRSLQLESRIGGSPGASTSQPPRRSPVLSNTSPRKPQRSPGIRISPKTKKQVFTTPAKETVAAARAGKQQMKRNVDNLAWSDEGFD
eukprot:scaffold1594_cov401-Prasinococcus_capsulatus_cf.AAC.6